MTGGFVNDLGEGRAYVWRNEQPGAYAVKRRRRSDTDSLGVFMKNGLPRLPRFGKPFLDAQAPFPLFCIWFTDDA
jgi:hypothetical protein